MTSTLAVLSGKQISTLSQDVEAYTQTVRNIPVLSAEEELKLADRFFYEEDLEAARQLVVSHLRFVVHIANGYRGYGLAQADLIQEGNIGLMKAVKRFDPTVGVRLVSFAVHWIRAEIHDYILRNWRIVKVVTTKAQRKLFFNLRSSKKRLGWMNQAEVETIAHDLGVTPKDVLEMEKRMSMQDVAFDAPLDSDDDDNNFAPATYLEDQRYDPALITEAEEWEAHGNSHLYHAFEQLDDRSRNIVQRRWLSEDKATLQELATEYGVSAERIRQIENEAMKKMKRRIHHHLTA